MRNDVYPKARSENLVIQTLLEETLVYDLTTHKAHCLNETSAFVWSKCTGDITVGEMLSALEEQYGRQVQSDYLALALEQLHERQLLDSHPSFSASKTSRRDALKKMGVVSGIALPIIVSLIAPTAAYASSSCLCLTPIVCGTDPSCPSTRNCNPLGLCVP